VVAKFCWSSVVVAFARGAIVTVSGSAGRGLPSTLSSSVYVLGATFGPRGNAKTRSDFGPWVSISMCCLGRQATHPKCGCLPKNAVLQLFLSVFHNTT
jgi:hypothetical protein